MDILVKNAIIVLPDRVIEGDISVADGKIAAIGERFSGSATQVIDAGRGHVIPGIIDLHGDDIEFEIGALGPKASARRMPVDLGLIQSDKNAAGWGITTKFHAIAYFEEESKGRSKRLSSEIMDSIARLAEAEHLLVDHWVDLRYEITGDPTYTLAALEHPRVKAVSLMDHTPGEGQFATSEAYKALNRQLTAADEEEFDRILAEKRARQHLKWDHVARVCERARLLGLLIASHDDHTPEKVEAMAAHGCRLAEMPVRLDAAQKAKALGLKVSMAAPNIVRGGSSSGNLNAVNALEAQALDSLCSDYHLPSLLTAGDILLKQGLVSWPELAALLAANAADALGLVDRGRIEPNKRADLAVIRTELGFPIIQATIAKGQIAYHDLRFQPS